MEVQLTALMVFAFVAAITPGPNNIMIMASGLNFGVRSSLPHYLGICFGFPTMLIATGFGMGFVFDTYPVIHKLIKVVGIFYLLYLAWLIAKSAPSGEGEKPGKPFTFFQGALFQWVNPKAWIMGTSAIATFTSGGPDIFLEVLIIVGVFFMFTFPSVGCWMILGQSMRRLISSQTQQRVFNGVMAILLVASVAPIGLELLGIYLP